MDFARTIRKIAVAVLCSASLLLAFGSTAFAAPHSSSTPTYVPCSRVSLQQIKTSTTSVGGGSLTATLYRALDSVDPATLCGYKAAATETGGPSGTLTATLSDFATTCPGIVEQSASVSSGGSANVLTPLGAPGHPKWCARAQLGSTFTDAGPAS